MFQYLINQIVMNLPIYQVDAFADELFTGNPAAVVILHNWLNDEILQKIAAENNLAETAFLVKKNEDYEIRWFTPAVEVDLCGHATLASAFVICEFIESNQTSVRFFSKKSGILSVQKDNNQYTLDFPADEINECSKEEVADFISAIGQEPIEVFKGKTDVVLVYESSNDIVRIKPDFLKLQKLNYRGVIVTTTGESCDFVSRFFAPQSGINEDPVTGSAHTTLVPYWANKLGKKNLTAEQLSQRGGKLQCLNLGSRVKISGKAKLYLKGDIFIK